MAKVKKRRGGPPFVQMFQYLLRTESWLDLSNGAKAAYLSVRALYNGSNNGRLGLGSRRAGEMLGMSKSSASRYLVELEEHGFIRRQTPSSFHQKKLSTEWALTEVRNDVTGEPPSRDFQKWRHPKTQKPVPVSLASVPPAGPTPANSSSLVESSPADGTDGKVSVFEQSHTRDTYTSSPEGGICKPANDGVVQNVVPLFRPSESDRQRALPDPRIAHRDDPLVQSILKIWPDAVIVITER